MGLVTPFSPEMLAVRLKQVGERVVKGCSDVIRAEAHEIEELAKAFAPVDRGNIEKAIKSDVGRGERGRLMAFVYVDLGMRATGYSRSTRHKYLRDYALAIHEGLENGGSGAFRLGKGSTAKDAGRGIVGGRFLERALLMRRPIFMQRVAEMTRRSMKL